jgi:hypothetical protein
VTTASPSALYEHTPAAADVPGLQSMAQTVRLTDTQGTRRVWVGWAAYTMEQARDLIASVQAAIEIGERAGLWVAAGTSATRCQTARG